MSNIFSQTIVDQMVKIWTMQNAYSAADPEFPLGAPTHWALLDGSGIPEFLKGETPIKAGWPEPKGHNLVRKHLIWTEADMDKLLYFKIY